MKEKKSIFERLKLIEKVSNSIEKEQTITREDDVVLSKQLQQVKNDEENGTKEEGVLVESENINVHNEEKDMTFDKIMTVEEIYEKFDLSILPLKSIFILDEFGKALPESLPAEVKRQSVLNILSASGIDLASLLEDGQDRTATLKDYAEGVMRRTEDVVTAYRAEIIEFEKRIEACKSAIESREKLDHEQRLRIAYELQRIEGIMKFVGKL